MMEVRLVEKLAEVVAKGGCECCHARSGLDQKLRSPRRHHAASDDDCGFALEIDENRQMAHGYAALRWSTQDAQPRQARSNEGAVVHFTRPLF